jgi:hypothetical protein
MPKGGHARSGPVKDPKSRTSERAGFTLTALPNEGYSGEVPSLDDYLPAATSRHHEVWAELWKTPQACAWSLERWRWPVIADLTKWMVRSDDTEAPAAVATAVRQLRDDLGLSFAGLRVNGWAIAQVEVGPAKAAPSAPKRERRLRSADAQ